MSKTYYISFYAETNGVLSDAFHERLTVEVARNHKDGRSMNKILRLANEKGRVLGADRFVIFEQSMPRVWHVQYDEEDF